MIPLKETGSLDSLKENGKEALIPFKETGEEQREASVDSLKKNGKRSANPLQRNGKNRFL